jgi:hypothetical protein
MFKKLAVAALCLMAASAARAQGPAAPPYRPLPIPLPDQAKVTMEIDAHQEDLLGVAKSLLKGLNLPALMQMMQGMAPGMGLPDIQPNGAPLPGAEEGAHGPGAVAGIKPIYAPNFADLLKGINQVHMVVFKPANKDPEQIIKFYEMPFQEQGGRRVLWFNQGANQVLMMGFREPRGFALIMPMGEEVTVIRADGYPDLEGVGSFVTMLATMVGSMRSTLSDIFDSSSTPPISEPDPEIYMPGSRPLPNRGVRRRPAKLAPTTKPAKAPVKKAPARK